MYCYVSYCSVCLPPSNVLLYYKKFLFNLILIYLLQKHQTNYRGLVLSLMWLLYSSVFIHLQVLYPGQDRGSSEANLRNTGHKAEQHVQTHIHMYGNLQPILWPIHLPAWIWTVGGRTRTKLIQTWEEHAKLHTESKISSGVNHRILC